MNIYEAIKTDQRILSHLASDLMSIPVHDRDTRRFFVEQILMNLDPHIYAKETVFYRPLGSLNGSSDLALSLQNDLREIERISRRLLSEISLEKWFGVAAEFKQKIEMNARQEESFMFLIAKKHFSEYEAEQLGLAFAFLKRNDAKLKERTAEVTRLMPSRLVPCIEVLYMSKGAAEL